ncbi:BREX-1 system phosphatase PglZ type A [Aliarcobacter butzleri]|uniref:BREX-1 system phosphatase PglZ type A n=1 Tax=Aliarcobacter butzleri TaxID=28197 RepID=UPI00263E48DA|nr:BREX-1 system phosphatase PglZ type A [Aliarcobacter butzleri]MDN5081982.1 BREX-1 system phosphatase PglZ type A [Aliarcobacter butzleri]MDN5084292.1 BREX-1 system phosphatase PglZ type A [Aliarcobacter butzleri]
MSKIEQRLNTLFQEHRIIIWYDEGGSLKDEFDSIELDIQKLELNNNEFGIKVKILYEDTKSKYLIYSKSAEPNMEDNWLLDIEQSFHKFSADPISMIVSELDLDITKKAFISEHKAFFNAKVRFDKYKSIITSNDSDEELTNKMISIVLNCDETFEEILFKLISNENLIEELDKYDLSRKLLKQISKRFKYQNDKLSITDLSYKFIQNHFYSNLEPSKCELNKEAVLFVKHWMDSNRHKELFKTVSLKVQNDLNISSIISNYQLSNVIDCDTYETCEQFVITKLRDLITSSKINEKEFENYLNKREHKFWYEKYENIYKVFEYAIKLHFGINNFKADISNFEDGINKYSTYWYEIDYNYRKFVYFYNKSSHKEIIKSLSILEDAYLNSYLRVLNDKWQNFVKDYSISLSNHQRNFYKSKVPQIVEKNQKVFVIISDALRYECAKELSKLISYENTESRSFNVKDNYMISSLPSYTQLGMASLLPNNEVEIKSTDDTVYVDGKSSKGKDARTKILQSVDVNSIALNDEEFLALNRNDGRELVKSNNIIYIYHNQIDAMGDDAITEEKVFDAVESSFSTIVKMVKQIVNLNGTNIFITADHGFIYTNKATEDSEFCKLDTTFMETSKVNRRFVIGKNLEENSCTQKFTSQELGIVGDNDFLITKSINKIRKQGGGNRFVHGGASLQELVIPLLEIKYQRKNVISEVEATIMPISTITTNNVNVSIYQEEPISDKVKPITLVCGFYGEDGVELSDKHKITLSSIDEENRNRENKLKFNFKGIADKYSGKFIKFTMKKVIENSSEQPIYKVYDVKLQLAFFNDFDEF